MSKQLFPNKRRMLLERIVFAVFCYRNMFQNVKSFARRVVKELTGIRKITKKVQNTLKKIKK